MSLFLEWRVLILSFLNDRSHLYFRRVFFRIKSKVIRIHLLLLLSLIESPKRTSNGWPLISPEQLVRKLDFNHLGTPATLPRGIPFLPSPSLDRMTTSPSQNFKPYRLFRPSVWIIARQHEHPRSRRPFFLQKCQPLHVDRAQEQALLAGHPRLPLNNGRFPRSVFYGPVLTLFRD
jgi:hypothetical protein